MVERVGIGAGIVGLGKWAPAIADAIGRSSAFRLLRCCSADPKRRRDFASRYGCEPADSLQSLLEDPPIEALFITSANHLHSEQALAAARARKHLFIEKPIALSLCQARDILRATRQAGVVLATGQITRRMSGCRKMKGLLEGGDLGQVVMAEANFSYPTGYRITPENWRWSNETCPTGPLMQLGIHQADALLYLLGALRRVSSFFRRGVIPAEIDSITATLMEFESGALAYLGSNYLTPPLFTLSLQGTFANVFFSVNQDTFAWERSQDLDGNSRLEIQRKGAGEREVIPLSGGDAIREEVEEFARCIQGGREPEVGGREGLEALGVVLAAWESARTGRPIDFQAFLKDGGKGEEWVR